MFKRNQWFLMENDSGGDGGGGGGGGGGDGQQQQQQQFDPNVLMRGLAVLAQGMGEMQTSQKELLTFLKENSQSRGQGGQGGGDGNNQSQNKGTGNLFDGVNMEELDRPQFAAMILTKFEERLQHHLEGHTKNIEKQIGTVAETLHGDLASRQIEAAQKGRPDFMEWRAEIANIVKENPGLNVVRAYTIARTENPTKAKQMDEKYKEQPKGAGGRSFSMAPGGGGGRGEGAQKMKFNEAVEKAWDEVTASLGGVDISSLPVMGGQRQ